MGLYLVSQALEQVFDNFQRLATSPNVQQVLITRV